MRSDAKQKQSFEGQLTHRKSRQVASAALWTTTIPDICLALAVSLTPLAMPKHRPGPGTTPWLTTLPKNIQRRRLKKNEVSMLKISISHVGRTSWILQSGPPTWRYCDCVCNFWIFLRTQKNKPRWLISSCQLHLEGVTNDRFPPGFLFCSLVPYNYHFLLVRVPFLGSVKVTECHHQEDRIHQ